MGGAPAPLGLCDDQTPALPGRCPANGGETTPLEGSAHRASFNCGGVAGCQLIRLSRRVRKSLVSHQTRAVRGRGSAGCNRWGGPPGANTRGPWQGTVVRSHRAAACAKLAGAQLRRRCHSRTARGAQPSREPGGNPAADEGPCRRRLYPGALCHVPSDASSNANPQAHAAAQEDQASACTPRLSPSRQDGGPARWSFAVFSWSAARCYASC